GAGGRAIRISWSQGSWRRGAAEPGGLRRPYLRLQNSIVAYHPNQKSVRAMNIMSGLRRVVREESARIEPRGLLREAWSTRDPKDEFDEMIGYWLEAEAGTAACNSRVARLPLRRPVPYVGTRS